MPRQSRATARDPELSYKAWKAEALNELQRQHDVTETAIPERVWTKLFVRRLGPKEAADRAEIYYRKIQPAGKLWRKTKR